MKSRTIWKIGLSGAAIAFLVLSATSLAQQDKPPVVQQFEPTVPANMYAHAPHVLLYAAGQPARPFLIDPGLQGNLSFESGLTSGEFKLISEQDASNKRFEKLNRSYALSFSAGTRANYDPSSKFVGVLGREFLKQVRLRYTPRSQTFEPVTSDARLRGPQLKLNESGTAWSLTDKSGVSFDLDFIQGVSTSPQKIRIEGGITRYLWTGADYSRFSARVGIIDFGPAQRETLLFRTSKAVDSGRSSLGFWDIPSDEYVLDGPNLKLILESPDNFDLLESVSNMTGMRVRWYGDAYRLKYVPEEIARAKLGGKAIDYIGPFPGMDLRRQLGKADPAVWDAIIREIPMMKPAVLSYKRDLRDEKPSLFVKISPLNVTRPTE